jgi:hypothetical protein
VREIQAEYFGRMAEQLFAHLQRTWHELERLDLPRAWWPEGWWATMDAPLIPLTDRRKPKPVRWRSSPPYIQFRSRLHSPRAR